MSKRKKTAYEILGVDAKASKETIKKAYRRKAKQSHPDKGGDALEFRDLAKAYRLLTDDAKRERYDRTGEECDSEGVQRSEAVVLLAKMFTEVIQEFLQTGGSNLALVKALRHRLHRCRETAIGDNQNLVSRLAKLKKAQSQLKNKGKTTLLETMLLDPINNLQRGIAVTEGYKRNCDAALELIADYKDTIDLQVIDRVLPGWRTFDAGFKG